MSVKTLFHFPACLVLAAMTASPLYAQDAAPPDKPQESSPNHPDRGFREGRGGGRPGEPFRRRNIEPPTEEEWRDISEFMKENLPNRWQAFEEKENDSNARNPEGRRRMLDELRRSIAARYRMYQRMEGESPALYAVVLEQAKAEDQVWGAWRDFAKDRENTELKTRLREKVAQLVKANLAERQQRLEQLRAALTREEKNLTADQGRVEQLIEEQVERWTGDDFPGFPDNGLRGMRGPMPPGGPGGPDGPGGDGPPPAPLPPDVR